MNQKSSGDGAHRRRPRLTANRGKVAISGFAEVALGQTIQHVLPACPASMSCQYVLANFKPTSNGLASRPFCDGTSAALIACQDIRQFSNAWCRENYDRQHEEPGKRPGLKPMPYERTF